MIKEFVMHYIFVDFFFFFTLFGIMMARKLLWLFSFVSYGGMTLIIFFCLFNIGCWCNYRKNNGLLFVFLGRNIRFILTDVMT